MSQGKRIWQFLVQLYLQFFEIGCSRLAAALAYSSLLSLVPFLMVMLWVVSYFPNFTMGEKTIQNFILNNFVAASASTISSHLDTFLQQARVLSWTTIIAMFVVSILMIFNLVNAFNRIWHIKMKRHYALSFFIYLAVLLIIPFIFGSLMFLSSAVLSLPWFTPGEVGSYLYNTLLTVVPYISAFITFTFLNWALPSCWVRLRYAVIAGVITTILFELAKKGFTLYLSYINTYKLIYGALATLPIFLVWLYLTWTLILFGALICYHLQMGVRLRLS